MQIYRDPGNLPQIPEDLISEMAKRGYTFGKVYRMVRGLGFTSASLGIYSEKSVNAFSGFKDTNELVATAYYAFIHPEGVCYVYNNKRFFSFKERVNDPSDSPDLADLILAINKSLS